MNKSPRRLHGLTLVEMLVVLAIIATLAGMLFPVLAIARPRVDISKCLSQLSQFGHAISAYRADQRGMFPTRRMLIGYSYLDANHLVTTTSNYANDGRFDGEFFFASYTTLERTAYGKSYRTVDLNPYFKCPAMIKLNPNVLDLASANAKTVGVNPDTDYRFTYQVNSQLDLDTRATNGMNRMNSNSPLMFCGGMAFWRDWGSTGGSVGTYLGPAILGAAAVIPCRAPQFPHYADPLTPDYSPPSAGQGQYKLWYVKGKCSVLKVDGSVDCQKAVVADQFGVISATKNVDFTKEIGLSSSNTNSTGGNMLAYWSGQ